jgi:enoyl-CoA hydratase/carnithine racemase
MTASATEEPALIEAPRDGVHTLCLNRPGRRNALTRSLLLELDAALERLARDPTVRCIVIAGRGPAFCAGHDLGELHTLRSATEARELFALCSRMMQRLRALPVPVIARVHGTATAAGCQLVGACDLAIAADTARFAVSGINVGLFCATPAVALSRNVATKRAFDLLVTGRFIDAHTACDYGLINEVVPESALDAAIERKAAQIAAKSPAALRHGKALFYRQRTLDLASAYELAGEVMAHNLMEADARRGIGDFLGRRDADRTGE